MSFERNHIRIRKKIVFQAICCAIITVFAIIPLFFSLPFRDNIYLSWEGAYRIYKGQVPFIDFGQPLGYGYWIIPTGFFYLFGPYLSSLIKAQVLINIISGASFVFIQNKLIKDWGIKTLALLVYVLSFSFYNFWPWYNHTVIVYEFISLGLLIYAVLVEKEIKYHSIITISVSAFFSFLAFFTKQDGGAFSLLIAEAIILYHSILDRSIKKFLAYNISYVLSALILILPVYGESFTYWFNIGQEPHTSRIIPQDFLNAVFGESFTIKFYFVIIVLILLLKSKIDLSWIIDKRFTTHLILTLGIMFQATILQVTSYVPADGNIYYHSFFFAFSLSVLGHGFDFSKFKVFFPISLTVFLWWSGLYWKYINRMIPKKQTHSSEFVSRSTFNIKKDTTLLNKSNWQVPKYKHFEKIKLPPETIKAISKIEVWNDRQTDPKVLNMSELTPLADILGYELERGTPLWYHLNVAFFQNELNFFNERIEKKYYDLVLFEHIPQLNNFYPFEIRDKLKANYELWFSFQAPREKTTETIEVYIRKNEAIENYQLE